MKKTDSDAAGVDFMGDLEQKEAFTPLKKEPVAKPKTGFNINFRDLEDVVSALTAAEMQLQNNISELKKLDNLAVRLKSIESLDTHVIAEKLKDMSLTHVSKLIVSKMTEDIDTLKKEIYASSAAAEAAAKDLNKKAENLRVVADGFNNLDNMSQDLQDFTNSVKKWRNKSMFIAIGLSLFFGLTSGAIVSNISVLMSSESIENAKILTEKFGEIGALHDTRDPKLYYFVIPDGAKVKEVVSFTEDGKRYIRIEAK